MRHHISYIETWFAYFQIRKITESELNVSIFTLAIHCHSAPLRRSQQSTTLTRHKKLPIENRSCAGLWTITSRLHHLIERYDTVILKSYNFIMQRPFSLVKVCTSGTDDLCIKLPESTHLTSSLATLTSNIQNWLLKASK